MWDILQRPKEQVLSLTSLPTPLTYTVQGKKLTILFDKVTTPSPQMLYKFGILS